jgi:hypothetical protein
MPDDVMLPLGLPTVFASASEELAFADLAPEDRSFLDLKAEQIRAVATNAVVEIGRHLIDAKSRVGHGNFLAWVRGTFGWSEDSAERYMAVSIRMPNSAGLRNFSREALYVLAGPAVPEEARDTAIQKAEDGEKITKAAAEKIIAEKTREGIERAVSEYRESQSKATQQAIAAATERLKDNNEALRNELDRIERTRRQPDTEEVCRTVERSIGVRKLTPAQYKALAAALGQTIVVGRVSYDPAPRETIVQNEENLRIASKITEALEILAGAPPADSVIAATWPVQRKQHARVCDGVIDWLIAYRELLNAEV